MPSFDLDDISRFKRDNPNYKYTIVKVYCDCCDSCIKSIRFNTRKEADEYLLREKSDAFIVIEYGTQ